MVALTFYCQFSLLETNYRQAVVSSINPSQMKRKKLTEIFIFRLLCGASKGLLLLLLGLCFVFIFLFFLFAFNYLCLVKDFK